ncbi:hypothetical protein ES708_07610 [subsurface metagenome]
MSCQTKRDQDHSGYYEKHLSLIHTYFRLFQLQIALSLFYSAIGNKLNLHTSHYPEK